VDSLLSPQAFSEICEENFRGMIDPSYYKNLQEMYLNPAKALRE